MKRIIPLAILLLLVSSDARAQAKSCLPTYSLGCTLTLSWKDNSSNEDNFIIERRLNGGVWSVIGTVGPNVTTYVDSTAIQSPTTDQTYEYRVYSKNASGNSAPTNIVGVKIPMPVPAPAAPDSLTISMNMDFKNASGKMSLYPTATTNQRNVVFNNRDGNIAMTAENMTGR